MFMMTNASMKNLLKILKLIDKFFNGHLIIVLFTVPSYAICLLIFFPMPFICENHNALRVYKCPFIEE